MKRGYVACALVLLLQTAAIAANPELDLFDRGYDQYLSYQPELAVESFHEFLRSFPNSTSRDAALYWLGKSYMQMRFFREAKNTFLTLQRDMAESPFVSYSEKELKELAREEREEQGRSGELPAARSDLQNIGVEAAEPSRGAASLPVAARDLAPAVDVSVAKKPLASVAVLNSTVLKDSAPIRTREAQAADEDPLRRMGEKRLAKLDAEIRKLGKEKAGAEKEQATLKKKIDANKADRKRSQKVLLKERKALEKRRADAAKKVGALERRVLALTEEKARLKGLTMHDNRKSFEQKVEVARADARSVSAEKLPVKGEPQERASAPGAERVQVAPVSSADYLKASGDFLKKAGVREVIWRTGDDQSDLEIEEAFYQAALRSPVPADEDRLASLQKKLSASGKETDYLRRFVLISGLIDRRLREQPAERIVEILRVEYTEDNQEKMADLASALQEQAKQGRAFEDMQKENSRFMTCSRERIGVLQGVVKEKSRFLRWGDERPRSVVAVWSEQGYLLLRSLEERLTYQPFEEVSPALLEKILPLLRRWADELRQPARS